jgi:hypothetical protein
MYGIHDVFPPHPDASNDPISWKKLRQNDGLWALVKDILGLTFNDNQKTVWLADDKCNALLAILKRWTRSSTRASAAIPFPEFRSITAKLLHAFITLPAGKGLLSPFFQILCLQPSHVYLHRHSALLEAVKDCHTLLRSTISMPTPCSSLVTSWPDIVGITDASADGAGGVIIGENRALPPTVFRVKWPLQITAAVVSDRNLGGTITNSGLELAGLLLLWLAINTYARTSTAPTSLCSVTTNPPSTG